MENGLELSFLGGITGTCFIDHISFGTKISDYKVGQKVLARVISADAVSKAVTLSLKSHIVNWRTSAEESAKGLKVGAVFEDVKVSSTVYGGSYMVDLDLDGKTPAFLHKTHSTAQAPETNAEDEGLPVVQKEMEVGETIKAVKVKEVNWFDGVPVVSVRDTLVGADQLNYHQIQIGEYLTATITKVDAPRACVVLRVNDFVQGNLHIEHMSDNPLKIIPPKF